MIYIITEEFGEEKFRYNAGSKARDDVEKILKSYGAKELKVSVFHNEERKTAGKVKSLYYHYATAKNWNYALSFVQPGDTVIFQFPVKAHTILFSRILYKLQSKSIQTIALLHDLECLRNVFYRETTKSMGYRLKMEEISALKQFQSVIVHNTQMKQFLVDKIGVDGQRIVELEIFDYLIPGYQSTHIERNSKSVIIAGNLDPDKSAYVYSLPEGCRYELFGANFSEKLNSTAQYMGKFLPDELPYHMLGGFGLVWDGPDIETCSGLFGNYLRYNNPHKTSLYLASGIPVLIWKEAAIADFIRANECGLTISSIKEVPGRLEDLKTEEYLTLCKNTDKIGQRLRAGYYTMQAVRKCGLFM